MSNELAIRTAGLTIQSVNDLARVSEMFASSGYFSDAKDAAQAGVKILAGQGWGIAPFDAMTGIHIIQGRAAIGAHLIAAKIKASGKYDYRVREMTDKLCEIEFLQGGQSIGVSSFSLADAKAAGTKNLDKFARNMLFARAMSNGYRWYCPDVFTGPVYTPEELGANVDGEGNVVTVERPAKPPAPQLEVAPDDEDVFEAPVAAKPKVIDAPQKTSDAPPLDLQAQSGKAGKPTRVTKAQMTEFHAIAKHTGLDSEVMAMVAEDRFDRDLERDLRNLTSAEADELVNWDYDKWIVASDAFRVPETA